MPSLSTALLALVLAAPAHAGRTLDGATVFQDNCGRCHLPRTPADLSPNGWRAVSFHMRVKANLTPAEFAAIEAFLVPAEPAASPSPVAASAGPPVRSEPTISAACLSCHDAERVQTAVDAGRDLAGWQATLTRMRAYGAKITADEAEVLATWLTEEAPRSDAP
jgi:cytochrome c553